MKNALYILLAGLSSILVTIILVPILKRIATKIGLLDKPNSRKIHDSNIPLIGGITIAFTLIITTAINPLLQESVVHYFPLFSSSILLLIVGAIDDKYDINAKIKLIIQLASSFFIAYSGTRITSLYGIAGINELPVTIQYMLTIILITGIMNAINLMDGVDGLAGEIATVGFAILLFFALYMKNYSLSAVYIVLIASLIVFLKFNLSKHEIFMGDAGSLFIGNILICSTLELLNESYVSDPKLQPYILFSFIGFYAVPVLDSLRVYLGRLKQGKSPFKADKTHLHHLLLLFGFSHKKISFLISILTISFLIVGVLIAQKLEISFWLLVVLIFFSLLAFFLNLNKKLTVWQGKVRELEGM